MRPIELALSIFTILTSVLFLLPYRLPRPIIYLLLFVLGLTSAAQIGYEGFRWQLWPLFIAVVLLLLFTILEQIQPENARSFRWLLISGGFLAALSLTAGWLLPIPKPYPITGPYQVGTITFSLTDTSRTEIYAPEPDQPREIVVQFWYPANPQPSNIHAPWVENIQATGPAIAKFLEIPGFSLNHLKNVQSNAYTNAPVVTTKVPFPLLIFSHGWSGFKEQNIYQVEELASHGYIVVGINHTYGAVMTNFPDGRQIPRNDEALPSGVSELEYKRASNLLVRQWAGDIGFVLDELARRENTNETWPLAGTFDLDRVGVFGHSTGGGAAAEFCSKDSRCKAALMMDLWVEPVSDEVVSAGLPQPFLLMHSAAWVNTEDPSPNFIRVGKLIKNSSGEVIEFRIEGTHHHDFTSLALLTPIASTIGLKGPIPGDKGLEIINWYTLAFYDHYLRNQNHHLLTPQHAPFEEVQFDLHQN